MAEPETSLREVGRDDLPGVAELLAEAWPQVDWPRRFRRQWFENPAWDEGWSLGWTHEVGGRPRSFFGSLPLPYWVDGREARGSGATALYVHPSLRRRGLAGELVDAWNAQEGPELLVNSTSNEASAGLFAARGLAHWPRGELFEASRASRPLLHARRAAARRFGDGAVAAPLRLGATWLGALLLRSREPSLPRDTGGWRWERLARPGAELDEFWARERPERGAVFRRDARSLEWLYFSDGRGGPRPLFGARDPAGELRGLAGFWIDRGTDQLRQADLFGGALDHGALAALLLTGVECAREAGCASVRLRLPMQVAGRLPRGVGLDWKPCEGEVFYRAPLGVKPSFGELDGDRCLELLG